MCLNAVDRTVDQNEKVFTKTKKSSDKLDVCKLFDKLIKTLLKTGNEEF